MLIAWYDRPTQDPTPEIYELSWPELCDLLKESRHVGLKKDAPGWSPAEIEGSRKNENVKALHALVLDFDGRSDEEISRAIENTKNYARLIHTTHSHAPGSNCLRFVFPLAAPVPADRWRAAWSAFVEGHGLSALVDPLKDPARFYYVPSTPGGDAEQEFDVADGQLLDLSSVSMGAPTHGHPVPSLPPQSNSGSGVHGGAGAPIDLDELRKCIAQDPYGRLLIKGAPLAPEGQRHNAVRDAANTVAQLCPDGVPIEALEELFVESFTAMGWREGEEGYADLRRCLESALEWWRNFREERRAAIDAVRGRLQRESAAVLPASAPVGEEVTLTAEGKYREEDLRRWAEENGCTLEDFGRRWIVSKDGAHYLFAFGGYQSAVSDKDVEARAQVVLRPAPVILEDLVSVDGMTSAKPRGIKRLRQEYGTSPLRCRGSLIAGRSAYSAADDTFTEALCPPRDITPTEHPEIARWLELMAPDEESLNRLLDWCATCGELNRATSALYLWGPKGCGKSLLAKGLSRIWTKNDGPTPMEAVVSGFNSLLATCPLVLADEDFPPDVPNMTAIIRRMLGNGTFRLTRKFLPDSMVDGYPRLIIAANDSTLFEKLREDLTQSSVDAVAERIRIMKVREEARPYLSALGMERTARWAFNGDQIAEHALFLRDTRTVDRAGRFLVPGALTETHQRLTIAGYPGALLQFLARAFEKVDRQGNLPGILGDGIKTGNGELWASARVFLDEKLWQDFCGQEFRRSPQRVGKALSEHLSASVPFRWKNGQRYYKLKPELLFLWIERNGIGDPESVRSRITAVNKDMIDGK